MNATRALLARLLGLSGVIFGQGMPPTRPSVRGLFPRRKSMPTAGAITGRGCFSVTVAGGGIAGGRVIGASDKDGMLIKDNPVQVPDFMASIYSRLGIDYMKENVSNIGRP